MRFLFTTLAGLGHFHPLVPVAQALESAGHVVCFATAPSFHRSVGGSGFPTVSAGFDRDRDGSDERFARLQEELETLSPEGPARTLFRIRNLFAGLYAEWIVPDLLAIATDWEPDVIVRDVAEFGGCIAAEVLGIPHASVRSNTMLSSDSARRLVAPQMTSLRVANNLEPDPNVEMLFRYLHLAFEPSGFSDPAQRPVPTAHLLRPVAFSHSGEELLPTWVSQLTDRPTVYATLGTVFNTRTPGLFEAILEGLRDEPANLILTIGRDRSPSDFGPEPDNVHIEPYIPQSLLLPYCDLVITHAGFSTVAAALSHGLPMVAIPIDADQPVNAQRCAALGVAEVLEYGRRTPESIRQSVRTLLANNSYRRNAEQIRDQTAALPGAEHGAALLERLAIERQPILNV
jgi:UDP:flavonoid glycosyltransferase YjiC (YdhE family)